MVEWLPRRTSNLMIASRCFVQQETQYWLVPGTDLKVCLDKLKASYTIKLKQILY
jgi:hypothetical protein